MDTHDSIEDARSTLMLYKAYQEFEEINIFDQKLEELYRAGRQYVSATGVQRSLAQFALSELETSST
jgi:PAB-dependent poly(A)-specific ribonuclease subunit 2